MTLYLELTIYSLVVLATVLSGGFLVETLFGNLIGKAVHSDIFCLRLTAFGILWMGGFFVVCFSLFQAGISPLHWWSWFFFLFTLFLASVRWFWISKRGGGVIKRFPLRGAGVMAGVELLLQLPSLVFYPHVLDCIQLAWTNKFVDPQAVDFTRNTGEFGYSALLCFTGLLSSGLPLVVAAAASKILIYFLLAATVLLIARTFYDRNRLLGIPIVALCVIGSSFGLNTFFLGKDSIFGILFAVTYLCMLSGDEAPENYKNAALFCGIASITGVITVPFLAIAAGLFVLAGGVIEKKAAFLRWHFLLALPLLALPVHFMVKVPIGVSWVIAAAGALLFFFVERSARGAVISLPSPPFWVVAMGIACTLLCIATLLPVLRILPGGGIFSVMAPFDGKTGFFGLLYAYNTSSGFLASCFLLAPFAALYLWRKREAETWVAFVYLPVSLCSYLLLCHLEQRFFDSWNLWDLVKDSVGWFLPPTAAMALGPIIARLPDGRRETELLIPFLLVVFLGSFLESVARVQMREGFLSATNQSGPFKIGKSNGAIPEIADYLWQTQSEGRLIVDSRTDVPTNNRTLQYFCPKLTISSDEILSIQDVGNMELWKQRTFLLVNESDRRSFSERLQASHRSFLSRWESKDGKLQILEIFPQGGEGSR